MCAFSRVWDGTDPLDVDNISTGPTDIRNFKDDVDDRLLRGSGGLGTGVIDITGTRTIETDPAELPPNKVDTIVLSRGAGGIAAVARAVTYTQIVTLVANYGVAANGNWQAIGLSLVIPSPPLAANIGHTNGAVQDTSDFIIKLTAMVVARLQTGAGTNTNLNFRIRNTTDNVVIGPGSTEALGAAGASGWYSKTKNGLGGGGADAANDALTWVGFDTVGRTIATTYAIEVFMGGNTGTPTTVLASPGVPCYLIAEVFKR